MATHRRSLVGIRGADIKSIEIREIGAKEEASARGLARTKGVETSFNDELCRLSIVAVDDVPVIQPCAEYDRWNQRTRQLVFGLFMKYNVVTDKELEDFLDSEPVEAPPAATT